MTANTPQSKKAKGRKLQQKIRDDIIENFNLTQNDVRSISMGAKGCDILLSENARDNFPYAIECKSQEKLAIPSWWEQTKINANEEKLTPLLIFKQSKKDIMVCLKWKDFLYLYSNKTIKES